MNEKTKQHNCPICKIELDLIPRYPNYICRECCERATDLNGRKLQFYNISLSGGYEASYVDIGEIYNSHICYIDKVKCYANEARFGGIVIEKLNE